MTPAYRILADGVDISGRLTGRMVELRLVDVDGETSDELTLLISNWDGAIAKPRKGALLSVEIGYLETGLVFMGLYKVQTTKKMGPKAAFEITAHAADYRGSLKSQKTRTHEGTLGAVVARIAGEHGLSAAVDPALAAVRIKTLPQTEESDMHLLTRLARQYGAIFKPAAGKLLFVRRGSGTTASGQAAAGLSVTPNDLSEFEITDQDEPTRKKTEAKWYDRGKASRESVVAGEGEPRYEFPHLFRSKEDAQRAVDARQRDFARAGKGFTGTLLGRPTVAAGQPMTTRGFGDDDDHGWTLKRVEHEMVEGGYTTRIEAEVQETGTGGAGDAGGRSGTSGSSGSRLTAPNNSAGDVSGGGNVA
ncbi:phage late control D family protein [Blastochloris tepida]|uniref:Phage late control protein n=1 Tax=Blastochloris tepida TaxID=2233851 RepID=A0A348FYG0_9HYPH|nr:contractile injection system protein, VgrG/Pvc8 family [Blastochloris tepida]BBF92343.1 phage late control protein [Blastochloris tepida]